MNNRIEYYKKKRNMSYKDIGILTGITPVYINMLATGKRVNPSFEIMDKISRALEEDVCKVFKL